MSNADEPHQIVRARLPGEGVPVYSTAALLFGVQHVVKGLPEKPKVPQAARTKSLEVRQKDALERAAKRFSKVKKMLENKQSNIDIADALKVSLRTINRDILESAELQALSQARGPKTRVPMEVTEARFREQEKAIRKALKKDALWKVALHFKFGRETLRRLLGMSGP